MANTHAWKFFRAGGVDQVVLASADDLKNLASLDQKLWAALACPSKGLEFDERTLTLLDTDLNGRIRPPEILAAIEWLTGALRDLGDLFQPSEELPLDSIAKDSPAGKDIHAGAKLILESLGKGKAASISLADVSSTEKIFLETKLNGDGIIPPESADDDATKKAIEDIISVLGSLPDRSTKPGVDQPKPSSIRSSCTPTGSRRGALPRCACSERGRPRPPTRSKRCARRWTTISRAADWRRSTRARWPHSTRAMESSLRSDRRC